MDFRNITRSMLFNRALWKFNSKENGCLLNRDIYVLLAVHYLSGINGCYRHQVCEYLAKLGRNYGDERIRLVLEKLLVIGYVELRGRRYVLALSGSVGLGTFEKILRNERYDR
jgi:hypothetical protein